MQCIPVGGGGVFSIERINLSEDSCIAAYQILSEPAKQCRCYSF
jgi:hypothetical protein